MSKNQRGSKYDDWEKLEHEAKPGYKTAFHIILTIAVLYGIYIFATAH